MIIDTTTETTDSGGSRHSDGGRGALRRFGPQFCIQRRGGVGPRAPPLDPPLDYSFESSKNDRHKSSLTGADQYLLPRTAFIKNGARLCVE